MLFVLLMAPALHAQRSTSEYCSEVQSYAAEHQSDAQLFSAVPHNTDPERDRWKKVSSQAELQSIARNGNSTAQVIRRDGHVVAVEAVYQNQFGDSTLKVNYCFRTDGTLEQLHSELKSYHGGMRVVRAMSFDEHGRQVFNDVKSFDLHSGQPRKLPSDFWDFPPPIFRRVDDLPFGELNPNP